MRLQSLATGLILQYSPAHGNETEAAQPVVRKGLHGDRAAVQRVGLCQDPDDGTEHAQVTGRGRAIHGARTWSETGVSRGIFQ